MLQRALLLLVALAVVFAALPHANADTVLRRRRTLDALSLLATERNTQELSTSEESSGAFPSYLLGTPDANKENQPPLFAADKNINPLNPTNQQMMKAAGQAVPQMNTAGMPPGALDPNSVTVGVGVGSNTLHPGFAGGNP